MQPSPHPLSRYGPVQSLVPSPLTPIRSSIHSARVSWSHTTSLAQQSRALPPGAACPAPAPPPPTACPEKSFAAITWGLISLQMAAMCLPADFFHFLFPRARAHQLPSPCQTRS
ncbi:hypothetical protein ACJQWK_05655 [Exserohilum turcicum]